MLITSDFTRVRYRRRAAEGVEYKFVPGTDERYKVGSDGTFWSFQKGGEWRPMKVTSDKGYPGLKFSKGKKEYIRYNLADLIMSLFGKLKPEGSFEANYIDGNPFNLRVENLEWVPMGTSKRDRFGIVPKEFMYRKGEEVTGSVLTERDVIEARYLYQHEGLSIRGLAKKYNVSASTMSNALTGVTWKHVPNPVQIRKKRRDELSFHSEHGGLSKEDVSEVEYLHAEGLNPEEIAEYTGIGLDKVRWLFPVGDKPVKYPAYQENWGGEQSPKSKLTDENVKEARQLYREGWTLSNLARRYKVGVDAIKAAIIGRTWKHLPNPVTPEETERTRQNIKNLFSEGWSPEEVSELTGVKLGMVRALIRQKKGSRGDSEVYEFGLFGGD